MKLVLFAAFALLEFAGFVAWARRIRRDTYQSGYRHGRCDANTWWLAMEEDSRKVREEIWKEELRP